MCGIVSLFLKDFALEPELGRLMSGMLGPMCDRGPDSAGFAVYGAEAPGKLKFTLAASTGFDLGGFVTGLRKLTKDPIECVRRGSHSVVSVPVGFESTMRSEIAKCDNVSLVGAGRRMEIFKDVGRPDAVAREFGLETMSGTHAVAHTRMATESAVTTKGAHPFTTGPDQCLVHNGSLSNHNSVRRQLMHDGLIFETENDSEVAAGFMTWKMRGGASLGEAMASSLSALDGFYTFVIGTESGLGVIRDPIACKPAVMAETDRWVAFGTEYRALVGLPGIDSAKVWEPEPAKAYFWNRAT